jgi:hypothetical protein
MTLTTAIVLIVLADVALIVGLAWAMSRPAKLTPHVPAPRDDQPALRRRLVRRPQPRTGVPAARSQRQRETAGSAS